ncbi:MAG: cation transporter [Eubacterium sp.]|nr:cation transporter [Eubacterium sp.]
MDREKKVIQTSIIGIIANIFLAVFKAAVGLMAHSVAITLDAVNNLSDALSSIITIIGTKLAAREPDKDHPLGHGRIEYLTAMVIAVIILYAGVTAFIESIKKIIDPETPDYSTYSIIIVIVAIFVKIILGTYVKKVGEDVKSDSLVASGKDALFDAVISTSTLIAAIIFIVFRLSLESYLGAVIAVVIIKSGFDILKDTVSELLGKRVDSELSKKVKDTVMSFSEVTGVYDLVIHNYGPDRMVGSFHVELPSDMTVKELDILQREIATKVYEETGVLITGVSVYSATDCGDVEEAVLCHIKEIVDRYKEILEIHGFYLEKERKKIRFDIIIDFNAQNRKDIYSEFCDEVKKEYPDYEICITLDADMTD